MLLCTQSNTRRVSMITKKHGLKKHDLEMMYTERFAKIRKEYGFRQDVFTGGQFTSSTVCEYSKGRRGMSVDKFVALLRLAKFPNKFIREHITEILKAYFAEVLVDLDLIKSPQK